MYTGSLKGPRAVYFLYGPNDVILYIGMTKNPRARFAAHKSKHKGTWWPLVTRHEVVWYDCFHQAELAETAALQRYRPLCNPIIPDERGKYVKVIKGRIGKKAPLTFFLIFVACSLGVETGLMCA